MVHVAKPGWKQHFSLYLFKMTEAVHYSTFYSIITWIEKIAVDREEVICFSYSLSTAGLSLIKPFSLIFMFSINCHSKTRSSNRIWVVHPKRKRQKASQFKIRLCYIKNYTYFLSVYFVHHEKNKIKETQKRRDGNYDGSLLVNIIFANLPAQIMNTSQKNIYFIL